MQHLPFLRHCQATIRPYARQQGRATISAILPILTAYTCPPPSSPPECLPTLGPGAFQSTTNSSITRIKIAGLVSRVFHMLRPFCPSTLTILNVIFKDQAKALRASMPYQVGHVFSSSDGKFLRPFCFSTLIILDVKYRRIMLKPPVWRIR